MFPPNYQMPCHGTPAPDPLGHAFQRLSALGRHGGVLPENVALTLMGYAKGNADSVVHTASMRAREMLVEGRVREARDVLRTALLPKIPAGSEAALDAAIEENIFAIPEAPEITDND